MGKELSLSLLQMTIVPGDTSRNVEKALTLLRVARDEGTTLSLLPEMFSSGFFYRNLPAMSRETPGVIATLRAFSRKAKMAISFSVPEEKDGQIYNTAYFLGKDGKVKGRYRKVHLFGLFKEDRYFAGGRSLFSASVASFRVIPLICYDLRFPEISRKAALMGGDIILYCAQWPKERLHHWKSLLIARAIENQLFVAGVNGTGRSGKIHLGGHSLVISPQGEQLLTGRTREGCYTVTIHRDMISHFRSKMNCLKDRRPDAY